MRYFLTLTSLFIFYISYSQERDSTTLDMSQSTAVNAKTLDKLNEQYSSLDKSIQRQTLKMLSRLQKKENGLKNKLQDKDSLKADQVFKGISAKYSELQKAIQNPVTSNLQGRFFHYIPGIDSMQTAMKFLNNPRLPASQLQQVQAISNQLQNLQARLQVSDEIQNFVRQREQLLKTQLGSFGFGKQIQGFNSEVYYYQQQLSQYKSILNDPQKQKELVLSTVEQIPAFQKFWQKYSILSQLQPMPSGLGTQKALEGLQTNKQIGELISQHAGGNSTTDANSFLQQKIQLGNVQMDQIKEKASKLGSNSGTGDMTMPDFTPNTQHTKKFLQRLEYGFNIQNTPGSYFLPVMSTIGIMAGYKWSDKIATGIGVAYQVGLGNGINNIKLSNQGISLRSYMNIRTKLNIWLTGGLEYNYMQQFETLRSIENLDLWQKSSLIGLTKKYSIGKKEGNIQLLYDLLANYEIPRGQSLKFRIGFNF